MAMLVKTELNSPIIHLCHDVSPLIHTIISKYCHIALSSGTSVKLFRVCFSPVTVCTEKKKKTLVCHDRLQTEGVSP